MNVMKQFRDGLFFQNPVTVQLLGMCSVMAITTTLFNGLGMGLSVLNPCPCRSFSLSSEDGAKMSHIHPANSSTISG